MDVASVYTYNEQGADLVGPAGARTRPGDAGERQLLPGPWRRPVAVACSSPSRSGRTRRWWSSASASGGGTSTRAGGDRQNADAERIADQVIGVLPASFEDPLQPQVELWQPENLQPGGDNDWDNNRLSADRETAARRDDRGGAS